MGKNLIIIVFLLALALIRFSPLLNRPFVGLHDFNGVFYGNIARNYLRYGLADTKVGQVTGLDAEGSFRYHINHPATLPLLIAGSYTLFGISEFSTRLIPLVASLSAIVWMFLLGKELAGRSVGMLASILMMTTPMFAYFGVMPVFEPLVFAASLFSIWQYCLWLRTKRNRHVVFLFIGLIGGLLVDWIGVYLLPVLTIHAFWSHGFKTIAKPFLFLWMSMALTLLLLFGHVMMLTGHLFSSGLGQSFIFRTGFGVQGQYAFSMIDLLKREARMVVIYLNGVLLLLSFLGLFGNKRLLLLLLFGWGTIHVVIFRNAGFIHEYLLFPLLAFICLSAAMVVDVFFHRIRRLSFVFAVCLIVLVLSLSFLERRPFLQTLQTTEYFRPGYELGQLLHSLTSPNDRIVVASTQFWSFYGPSTAFYADRQFEVEISSFENADYVVQVKSHDELQDETTRYLKDHFPYIEKGAFVVYDLRA
ncbi:MAG: glycosyltransferase family 39 protein [bacterium]|nr:glycosyltransferase family 39 protein [bacterium]